MGVIKEKVTGWIQKATTTATDTVKQITKEDASKTLDVFGNLAKIGIFAALTISAFKSTNRVAEYIEPVAKAACTTTPVVQIFLGEGKGVHIE